LFLASSGSRASLLAQGPCPTRESNYTGQSAWPPEMTTLFNSSEGGKGEGDEQGVVASKWYCRPPGSHARSRDRPSARGDHRRAPLLL